MDYETADEAVLRMDYETADEAVLFLAEPLFDIWTVQPYMDSTSFDTLRESTLAPAARFPSVFWHLIQGLPLDNLYSSIRRAG